MNADPALDELVAAALTRLEAEWAATPALAPRLRAWTRALAGGAAPAAYFQNPISFPLLRLPRWLAETLRAPLPADFQAELVFSSINGYYFIRLLDNVMDQPAAAERGLLPAAAVFHAHFQLSYQRFFPAGHPFWTDFTRHWARAAEVTVEDGALTEVDEAAFQRWAGRKVGAALIPLAAVAHAAHGQAALPAWTRFVDAFGAWHQLFNDVFDWSRDLRLGAPTYFLWEAGRRKRAAEPAAAWVAREGFQWGLARLQTRLAEARALAVPLHSPPLLAYLDERAIRLEQQAAEVTPGLTALARLAAVLP